MLLLLSSEAMLTLPAATAAATTVATFYTNHRTLIMVLQLMGFAAAGLLAGYFARLRTGLRWIGSAGLLTAALSCAPGLATIMTALVADPAAPRAAGVWNARAPRADDLLFVGILVLGTAVVATLRGQLLVRALAAAVTVLCGIRLVLEATRQPLGVLESIGPIAFILLVLALGTLSARGRLPHRTPLSGELSRSR
jgi:hypothetical protein